MRNDVAKGKGYSPHGLAFPHGGGPGRVPSSSSSPRRVDTGWRRSRWSLKGTLATSLSRAILPALSPQGACRQASRRSFLCLLLKEPEVAYLHEPVGEDVEEEPPDELGRSEGHNLLLGVPVGIVFPEEGDFAILRIDDVSVSEAALNKNSAENFPVSQGKGIRLVR
jgi:hypothetical protein